MGMIQRRAEKKAASVFCFRWAGRRAGQVMYMKVYGSDICGDCRAFKAVMAARGFEVEYVDMTENTANLREFLQMRDREAAFDEAKKRGGIGIPAFVREDGLVTLDLNTALAWIGQEPVEEDGPGCESCR